MSPRWEVCENLRMTVRHQGCMLLSPHSNSRSETDTTTWQRQVIKNINYSPSYCRDVHHNGHRRLYHMYSPFICFIQLIPKIFLSAMVPILTISIHWKTWLKSNTRKFTISLNKLLQLLHRHACFIAVSIWPDWTFKHCTFVCLYYWNLRAVICLVTHSLGYAPYWLLKS